MPTLPFDSWLMLAGALAVAALGFDLGGYPLLDPDEGRNAEVAREMAETNDYVHPRLNGLPYPDKPVLFFAAVAAVMELLGPNAVAARLPSLLFTGCTVLLVVWFGNRLFGRGAGVIAGIAAAAAPLPLAYARTVIFDSALTFFVVAALVGFYESVVGTKASPQKATPRSDKELQTSKATNATERTGWWRMLAWGAMAFGVLTKGPIALALPLMIAIPFAATRRAWRGLADVVSVLLFVALLSPWLLAMSREIPGFLEYAIVTETTLRLTTPALQRTEPFWYFLLILPAAALPWTVVVIGSGRTLLARPPNGLRSSRLLFLLLWILVPLIFFSLSQSKRPQYVLPLVPAFALLVGGLWTVPSGRVAGTRLAASILALLGASLLIARGSIANIVSATPAIAATIPATALALGIVCITAALGAWIGAHRPSFALVSLCVPIVAIPFVSRPLMDEVGRERSARDLARAIEQVITPETEIVGVHAFPLSLPFYLQRTLVLSTSDGAELTSNYLLRHLDRWSQVPGTPLRPPDWWRDALALCDRPRVFVTESDNATARVVLEATLPPLVDTGRFAAYGPCGFTGLASGARPGRWPTEWSARRSHTLQQGAQTGLSRTVADRPDIRVGGSHSPWMQ